MEADVLPEPLEVVVAVIEAEGLVLISKRLPEDSFGGYWEFPGGKRMAGETSGECLAREIQEELGLTIEVGEKRMSIEHQYPQQLICLEVFDCQVTSGAPQARECSAWRWVRPDQLKDFQFPPASSPLMNRF